MTAEPTIIPSVEPLVLELSHPFRIAHGTSDHRTNALLRLGDSYGEAALPPYYSTTLDDVEEYVSQIDFSFLARAGGFAVDREIARLPDGPPPAMAAVDMALHDIWARQIGLPLYRLFGLEGKIARASSFSQSIPTDEAEWRDTLSSLSAYPFLKIKLGSGNPVLDEDIVRIARDCFSGRLAVDANSAWSIPEAVAVIPRLTRYRLEFIEQPISYENIDDWHLLRRLLRNPGVPLIADESVHTADDVIALSGAADGVNLKLAKCGGIRKVRSLIDMARALDLTVMLGCMIESSLALTAASHLASLVDYLDLDAMLHLAADPFTGVSFESGYLSLPTGPGLGVSMNR